MLQALENGHRITFCVYSHGARWTTQESCARRVMVPGDAPVKG